MAEAAGKIKSTPWRREDLLVRVDRSGYLPVKARGRR
jgi:hypothetical protein